jgi:Zn-dependent M16 (insulinase) family peptidase
MIFDLNYRLEVTAAKIQQSLPEAKRDGNTVVSSLSGALVHASSSTTQAATVLNQVDFIPRLMEKLKRAPDEVVADMLDLRKYRESGCACFGAA